LNLFPDKVYLHAGTRLGARALGLRTAATLKMSELPKEFRALKPHEIEDVLPPPLSRLTSLNGAGAN
jgi:hypothetical protein